MADDERSQTIRFNTNIIHLQEDRQLLSLELALVRFDDSILRKQLESEIADSMDEYNLLQTERYESLMATRRKQIVLAKNKRARGEENGDPQASKRQRPTTRSQTKVKAEPEPPSCEICAEPAPDHIVLKDCGHIWCKTCLKTYFVRASKSESEYPPRCCKDISYKIARPTMTYEEAAAYRLARVEYRTPSRFYCGKSGCGIFIHPGRLGDTGIGLVKCRQCEKSTCQKCKKVHESLEECEEGEADEASEALLGLAKQEGWKQCTRCARLVEKSDGCPHIVCYCGHEFCYDCGKYVEDCKCGY